MNLRDPKRLAKMQRRRKNRLLKVESGIITSFSRGVESIISAGIGHLPELSFRQRVKVAGEPATAAANPEVAINTPIPTHELEGFLRGNSRLQKIRLLMAIGTPECSEAIDKTVRSEDFNSEDLNGLPVALELGIRDWRKYIMFPEGLPSKERRY